MQATLPYRSSFVPCAPRYRSFPSIHRGFAWAVSFWLCSQLISAAQIPNINIGPDAGMASIDFAQIYLDGMNRNSREREKQRAQDRELIGSGVVSALDLEAPNKAVEEYNRGTSLLKRQDSKEAIKHLQRAIDVYPKFVSAHIALDSAISIRKNLRPPARNSKPPRRWTKNFPDRF